MIKLQPQNNQIVVSWKDETDEELTKFGLVIPKFAKEAKLIEMGEVIAASKNIVDRNGEVMDIKKGDKVLFVTFHPFELELNGEKVYTLPASEIVAILVND